MNLDHKLTDEILTALGFVPGKWKSGMIADHRTLFLVLENGDEFSVVEYEAYEGGSYGGYDVEAYPGGYSLNTIGELVEDFKKECTPDQITSFMTLINKLP